MLLLNRHSYAVKSRNSESYCSGNLALVGDLPLPGTSPYTPHVKSFSCNGSHYNGNLILLDRISVPEAQNGGFYIGFRPFADGNVWRSTQIAKKATANGVMHRTLTLYSKSLRFESSVCFEIKSN